METVSVTEETFEELRKEFQELKKVHDEKITSQECGDPITESEPLDEHFDALVTRLNEILTTVPNEDVLYMKLLSMKASLMYEQAKILMSVDNLDGSQAMLEKALEMIKGHHEHPQITFLYMRIINHLAYMLSKRGEFERSRELLESILEEKEPKNNMLVYSTDELFSTKELDQNQATSKLNKLVANNLQMLGWIYGRLDQPDVHASKQHMALGRQLQSGDCDPIGWACRCSRLAALYLTRCNWVAARYHLLAAGVILDRLERELVVHPDLAKAQADLARGWINYGLHLFSNSKTHLVQREYPGNFNEATVADIEPLIPQQEDVEEIEFSDLQVNPDGIPATPIRTTEQARGLFLYTHTWLKRARLYYTLRDFPIHYVNAVLDLSELYRFLAYYEPDLDSQYNVQKRRADALETLSAVLREVRPQCYIAVSVELLRELAEVQIEMMGINLRRLHMSTDGIPDDADNLKRRISAISNIQLKLESVGDVLGQGSLEEQDVPDEQDVLNQQDVIDQQDIMDQLDVMEQQDVMEQGVLSSQTSSADVDDMNHVIDEVPVEQ